MELVCQVQNYDWGKKGSNSKVAVLCKNANKEFTIDENLEYAELWMGTHRNAPSIIKESNRRLASLIADNPQFLGHEIVQVFGERMPFLFKVLSINKALSIQAHPTKKHAQELNANFPDIYKDSNHKPELAVALTPFEALCGFRPISEIKAFIKDVPELNKIVNWESLSKLDDVELLKTGFRAVLTCDKDLIAAEVQNMLKRLASLDKNQRAAQLADLVEQLNSQFPNDAGIFMVYFLNYLQLKPTEAIYLGANEPHCYLSGDCVECMASSDNVVRAGLTSKFVDVDTLCSMLTYEGKSAKEKLFEPIEEDDFSKIFKPPVADFALVQIQVPASAGSYTTIARNSGSILLVVSGCGKSSTGSIMPGTTLFIPAYKTIEVTDLNSDLVMYQALANVTIVKRDDD